MVNEEISRNQLKKVILMPRSPNFQCDSFPYIDLILLVNSRKKQLLFMSFTNASISKPHVLNDLLVKNITTIDDDGCSHYFF